MDKAADRMRETFANIGQAFTDGFDKGNSLIDTSGLEQHLSDAVGGVMDHVQSVSEQSRKSVEPAKPFGPMIDPEEDATKGKKPAISAIQRIGGGGAAYGAGDPMLREQQRQTRELTTQTVLLRDVKRAVENNKPTASLTSAAVFA